MGWANCGTDTKGRPIGYAHVATCDRPGCNAEIDRGLAYACGNEHLATSWSCEGYFCEMHLSGWVKDDTGRMAQVCAVCEVEWRNGNPEAAKIMDGE